MLCNKDNTWLWSTKQLGLPHYFSACSCLCCFQLVQDPDTAALGLILLQTTSEELASPREDLSVARKEELHKLLLQQVPTVLSLLNGELPRTTSLEVSTVASFLLW